MPIEHRVPAELGSMLSMASFVSETPNCAERVPDAATAAIVVLVKIGAGTCGTVLAQYGINLVFKIAKHDTDALTGDLFNDFKMHKIVQRAMLPISNGIDFARVPRVRAYIPSNDTSWWDANEAFCAAAAEKGLQIPSKILCTERIVPLPLPIRSALIDKFCPEVSKMRAEQDASNNDCLVRVYLGARKVFNPRSTLFSLRNYKLHLNQMLELGMDVDSFGRAMAGTLAYLHWKARIDAKDVEFVLGSSPETQINEETFTINEDSDSEAYAGPASKSLVDWHKRTIDLWLLDFNLCSRITMDKAGVEMAAKAWQVNDPYYPKPLQDAKEDQELWDAFVSRYIEVSDRILQTEPGLTRLPREFIASIVHIQREKNVRNVRNATSASSI